MRAAQELRGALLRLVTHAVVANSALVPLCLRVLAAGLQPPPAPPPAPQPDQAARPGGAWEPSEEAVAIQGQVVAALEKVRGLCQPSVGLPAHCLMCMPSQWTLHACFGAQHV